MDIQQPSLYHPGMGGGGATAMQSRFLQDVYRSVKCPNFSVSRTTYQDCASAAWTNLTWDYVHFNNLNAFNTTTHRLAPTVPGYYHIHAKVTGYWTGASPSPSTSLYLGIWDSNDVTIADMYVIPPGAALWGSGAMYVSLRVTGLAYLSGMAGGTGRNDYKFISLYNDTQSTFRILGRDTGSAVQPGFQAHKITY